MAEQQLTEGDVPVLVDRCIDYITQCGMGQLGGGWGGFGVSMGFAMG